MTEERLQELSYIVRSLRLRPPALEGSEYFKQQFKNLEDKATKYRAELQANRSDNTEGAKPRES